MRSIFLSFGMHQVYALKKIFTILLLFILSFNLIGYKCWFAIRELRSVHGATAPLKRVDANERELITVKVPLSLPYSTNWSAFERYDGSIEIAGHHYNYVKRKITNDTLILLCLPNTQKDRLAADKLAFEKLVSGDCNQDDRRSSTLPALLKLLTADYFNDHHFCFAFPAFAFPRYPAVDNEMLFDGVIAATWQPPDGGVQFHC